MKFAESKLIDILKTHHISDAVDCAKAIGDAFPQIRIPMVLVDDMPPDMVYLVSAEYWDKLKRGVK